MRRPRVLVMIDQATRDAFSQLLVVHYLRSKGAKVFTCNQVTWAAAWERHKPDVVYISWLGGLVPPIERMRHKAKIALIDHEGGRLGEVAFKRSFQKVGDDKRSLGGLCSAAFTYGRLQKTWLTELGVVAAEKIKATGSPRWDPYIEPTNPDSRRFIGFTLRADAVTAQPDKFIEHIFDYAGMAPDGWLSVGYPRTAQQEDRIWHVASNLRYMFKILIQLRKVSDVPVVLRPGPWEQPRMYEFLTRRFKNLLIDSRMPQPEYVRNAFAVIDESSSLGLEALLVGTPVISTHGMIPNLAERIGGGEDAGLFHAPYKKAFWAPGSVDEAVELLLKAEKQQLPTTPDEKAMNEYLEGFHHWPRMRPSSFEIGDTILSLAATDSPVAVTSVHKAASFSDRMKSALFQYVPGSLNLFQANLAFRFVFSPQREHLRKYHYLSLFYPHKKLVRSLFERLEAQYDRSC